MGKQKCSFFDVKNPMAVPLKFTPDAFLAMEAAAGANNSEFKQKRRRKISKAYILMVLSLANMLLWVAVSCTTPYFAIEATERKGQSTAQIGIGSGIAQLFTCFFAPLCGKYMSLIREHRATYLGILSFTVSTFCFGLCDYLEAGWPFFYGILLCRIVGSMGICAFITGSWAIIGRVFSERISALKGTFETINSLGFTVGPFLGSSLYAIGGFMFPLLVVGCFFTVVTIASFWLPYFDRKLNKNKKSNHEIGHKLASIGGEEEEEIGIFQLLRIPNIFMNIYCLFLLSIGWTFYEPSLAGHIASFNANSSTNSTLTSAETASIMSWTITGFSVAYLLFAPLWGFLFERYFVHNQTAIMVIGSAGIVVSMVMMGPTPVLEEFGVPKSYSLLFTAFVLNGIFSALLYIPILRWCLDAVKAHGLDETSAAINGCIAGIIQSIFSLGSFVATAVGGVSAQFFGFAWTATGIALLQIIFVRK